MNNTVKILLGAGFAVLVAYYASSIVGEHSHGGFLILAAIFGAYMAMNIGANDVANNVGPAVGSGALTIGGAIIIASIFEAGGALIAGGDVVGTIKKGIIDPSAFGNDPMVFVYAMSAALLAAALWLNLATWLKAPVSTTHSIVGGVLGGGIAAGGFAIVSWGTMGKIAASWVISPVLGGPLIFAAALLSFAHGANDVANAVGPLAAVYDALSNTAVSTKVAIPLWVMVVGGVGISIGLALFGPRLIKTVGSEITELDQMRAFSIMMAAAITVVIASQLGLPVSSTHIAVGAIFGVGFLREWLDSKEMGTKQEKLKVAVEKQNRIKEALSELKTDEDYKKQIELMQSLKVQKKKVKSLKRTLRENYVKRGMVKKIVAAWVITVPAAAVLSAIIFFVLKGFAV